MRVGKAPTGRTSRAQADGNRDNAFERPPVNRTAKYFIPALGVILISIYLGCRTLSTTRGLPSPGPVNGMLYYLPIEKITTKGEFKPSQTSVGSQPSEQNTGWNSATSILMSSQLRAVPVTICSYAG